MKAKAEHHMGMIKSQFGVLVSTFRGSLKLLPQFMELCVL